MGKRIQVIINPAAGRDLPVLRTLNNAFKPHDITWDVSITLKAGDAARAARKALRQGVNIIAVYGGDGTIVEAATCLNGAPIPLGILPGGTANAFAREMGVPLRLAESAALIAEGNYGIRQVDVGEVNRQLFLVGVGTGLIAKMMQIADRDQKDRLGFFAYPVSALQAIFEPEPEVTRYKLTLDDEKVEMDGVACYVANAGNFGIGNISLLQSIDVSDQMLDVVLFRRADIPELLTATAAAIGPENFSNQLPHWKARKVTIESDPPQMVMYDGEVFKPTPVTISLRQQGLKVIVPPQNSAPQT